ncbi:hypothetical protein GCM10009745_48000 [Kribbella yunnanensis]|uniref:Resolvase/invertase-type recombinase catalytic domain-containing protein n=1 Tax=Kribbella yunnanensis TaxID=190194 RepID=A0ABP4TZC0_9ACTN
MTDYTRPLLLGYVRQDLLPPDYDAERMKRLFEGFARAEGFAMGSVYAEHRSTAPAAFHALIESLDRYELTAVVMPSWEHLELVGDPAAVKQQFERVTGARFLLHDPSP